MEGNTFDLLRRLYDVRIKSRRISSDPHSHLPKLPPSVASRLLTTLSDSARLYSRFFTKKRISH